MASLVHNTKLLLLEPEHALEGVAHVDLLFAVPLPVIASVHKDELNCIDGTVDS